MFLVASLCKLKSRPDRFHKFCNGFRLAGHPLKRHLPRKGDGNEQNRQQRVRLAGVVSKRLLSGEQTAGQFCLLENKSDGNTKTPIHVHARDDETVYIIEGELTVVIDGRLRRLTAGESIFLSRGIPHQLMNMSGTPCRYILIGTPALFERFIEEGGHELQPDEAVGPPTPEEIERLREASPKFGITLLADWPSPVSERRSRTADAARRHARASN